MARSFTAASSMYLTVANAIVTGMPMTMACWFNPNDVTGTHSLISVADTGSGNAYYLLVARGGDAGDPVTAQQGDAASSYLARTSTSFVANTWQHAAAIFSTSNVRVAYLNGGGRVEDNVAASTNDTLLDTTAIGVLQRSTLAAFCDGLIAEAGIWNVALTTAEIVLLAAGYSPAFVRPGSLVAYWPLIGRTSPEIDVKGRFELTLTNAPGTAAHCRIIRPSGGWFVPPHSATSTTYTYVPSGGLTFGGAGAVLKQKSFTPTGGLVFAGTALLVKIRGYLPSGGLVLAGGASIYRFRVFGGSGLMTFGGSATTSIDAHVYVYAPSGGFFFQARQSAARSARSRSHHPGASCSPARALPWSHLRRPLIYSGVSIFRRSVEGGGEWRS